MGVQDKKYFLSTWKQEEQTDKKYGVYRGFFPTERYKWDFDEEFRGDGWMQYDTEQDAHYFGMWVNPKLLSMFTYAEGDHTLVVCPDVAAYNEKIKGMNEFYTDGFICKTIDEDGTATVYIQDRDKFFIGGHSDKVDAVAG